jgi:hypothetical protein
MKKHEVKKAIVKTDTVKKIEPEKVTIIQNPEPEVDPRQVLREEIQAFIKNEIGGKSQVNPTLARKIFDYYNVWFGRNAGYSFCAECVATVYRELKMEVYK